MRRPRAWLRRPRTRAVPGLRPGSLRTPARSWLTPCGSRPAREDAWRQSAARYRKKNAASDAPRGGPCRERRGTSGLTAPLGASSPSLSSRRARIAPRGRCRMCERRISERSIGERSMEPQTSPSESACPAAALRVMPPCQPGFLNDADHTRRQSAALGRSARDRPCRIGAFRQPHLHSCAAAGVPVRARGVRGELYRARHRGCGVQCHLGAAADARGLSGRSQLGAPGADRRAPPWRAVACGRGDGAGIRAARRRLRVPWACQHGLSSGRLCAAVQPGLARPRQPGLLDPYFRGLHRHRDHARFAGDPRELLWLAHRVPRGSCARTDRCGHDRDVRRAAGRTRTGGARRRPMRRPRPPATGACSRPGR